jgi:hypothetical protein
MVATSREVLGETVSTDYIHIIYLLTDFATSERMAQRTAQLSEDKTQKARVHEQDELFSDTDAGCTEDDSDSGEDIPQHPNAQYGPGRQRPKPPVNASGSPTGHMSAHSGLPRLLNHFARRPATGIEDLQNPGGRCVILNSVCILG